MAINVTKFLVANDLASIDLDVTVTVAETVTAMYMWTDATYKDPAQKIDLTSLLAGATNSESLTITAAQAGLSTFNGLYFVQLETSDSEAVVIATVNLTQYYIIQAKLIANIDLSCLNCNGNFQNALLFDMYLTATQNALIIGRFQDAIGHLEKLIITVDTSTCDECNDIEPVVSTAGNIVSVGVIDCLLTVV